jgi:hypothetical protein
MFAMLNDFVPSFSLLNDAEKLQFILGNSCTDSDILKICINSIHNLHQLRLSKLA